MKTNILIPFLLVICLMINVNGKAQLTTISSFTGTNGETPTGSLYFDGTFLYGMTSYGGTNNLGNVFKIKPDGTAFDTLLNFNTSNGASPTGSVISDGSFLYGMTIGGGSNGKGVIFKIKSDGTNYTKLLDFIGTTNGGSPQGSLIYDGLFLYGMTIGGGSNGKGVIFKIKPDGTGYVKLLDFSGTANGSSPYGDLLYDGTYLYGMTELGGLNNFGIIFKIKPDGTGYTDLLDFNGTNGFTPQGSLISDGSYLYGMTTNGGSLGEGILFKIKPDGTGYSIVWNNFTGNPNGSHPYGALLYDGTFLYGMTETGGGYDDGIIFKIRPDGTDYTDLCDFSGATGSNPQGTLISDGVCMYGMTSSGGSNSFGTVFKFCVSELGIESNAADKEQIYVYPNPSTSAIHVTGITTQITSIQITDVLGTELRVEILDVKQGTTIIDVSNLQNGIYFIKTTQGAQKFIKQ
jgi:uncharacterized repeat protein (TIGR03803 family)